MIDFQCHPAQFIGHCPMLVPSHRPRRGVFAFLAAGDAGSLFYFFLSTDLRATVPDLDAGAGQRFVVAEGPSRPLPFGVRNRLTQFENFRHRD